VGKRKKKDSDIYLGLDISGTCTGYAVVEHTDGEDKVDVLEIGHIKTYSSQQDGQRMKAIHDKLDEVLKTYDFAEIAKEKGFTAGNRSTQLIFKATGVSEFAVTNNGYVKIYEYAPTTIKKQITGNGKATKEEVEEGLRRYLKDPDITFETNDESDATAVVVTHLKKRGNLK
jgi:crossover junction endodeoxyribonuclease RuvC